MSGETDELDYVSPRTGHAVKSQHAGPYKDSYWHCLLVWEALKHLRMTYKGLSLTGHFLETHLI